MSESNRYRFCYVAESVYGTTPTNPAAEIITVTGGSMTRNKSTVQSNDLRSDAQISAVPQVSVGFTGETPVEFRSLAYNKLIAAALRTSSGASMSNGVLMPSFTTEESFLDVGQFRLLKGMRVGSMSISASVGSIVTGSFGWMGATETVNTTGLVLGTGSRAAASTNVPWNATSNVTSVSIGGSQTTVCVQSFDLTINNNLRENHCVGSALPTSVAYGSMSITGNLRGVFDAWDKIYNTFVAHTPVALSFAFTGAESKVTTISLPVCYITAGTANPGGTNTNVEENYSFQAVPDSGGTSITITYV